MKKHLTTILLALILLIAIVLRFWELGSVPVSPDWDEAALGYNAYSIIHTGRDEYGEFLPIVLRSFDDYKPAFYMYLTIPFILLFDLSVVSVRLPSAVMGVVTVAAVYFLVKELFRDRHFKVINSEIHTEYLALLAAFLLAISPWHLQFSRVAFETNVGLGFNVLMALFFLKGLRSPNYLSLSAISGALSIYTYQSEKVFTPLLLLSLVVIYWKELIKIGRKKLILTVLIGSIVIAPMAYVTLTNTEALARARGVSIFSDKTTLLKSNIKRLVRDRERNDSIGLLFDNRRVVYGQTIAANYLSHFDPVWLFIKGDYDINRHHAPHMGLEYLVFLPFLLVGIYQVLFGVFDKKIKLLLFCWLLLAPIPASITTGVPHAVRTLNFLPTIQIFIGFGLLAAYLFVKKYFVVRSMYYVFFILITCYILLAAANFVYYLNQYFVQQNYYHSLDWQYGYKELITYLRPIQNKYTKIIVSNRGELSQSYIFFLFYTKYDPKQYLVDGGTASGGFETRANGFENFEFRTFDYEKESTTPLLLIGAPGDFNEEYKVIHSVPYLNGTTAIKVVEKLQ